MTSNATTMHYDNDVRFFQSFLDPYMKYTSALFRGKDETLDQAIVNMLDELVSSGGVKEGSRVLEIGCGWGSLLRRLRERFSSVRYEGISPSEVQNAFIAREIAPDARLFTQEFESWTPDAEGAYDAVFLIGSFCHLRDKRQQLGRVRDLLAPGGRVVVEDTFFLSEPLYQKHKDHALTRFVQRDIFGFAEVPSLAAYCDMCRETGLKITRMLEHTDSYAHTIGTWMGRLAQLDAATFPLAGAYVDYMRVFQRGWNRTIGNYIVVMQRLP